MPDIQRMFGAVERLRTTVEPVRGEMDRARKLPRQIVDLMREEGLLSIWLPTEYGGPDLNMPDSVRLIEALARRLAGPAAGADGEVESTA